MIKTKLPIYLFTGLAAILMASVAAYFSITGLAALFSAAAIPVIIMGSCIEFSKIVSTVWLHKFWKAKNYLITMLLSLMVLLSMAITSGGVYGYLTGSHAAQEAPAKQHELVINRYDQQIAAENERIDRNQKRLSSLDSIVSSTLTQEQGGSFADRVNRRQSSERTNIQKDIDQSYSRIDQLTSQKLEETQKQSESDVKLGAVKYLAGLFGADPTQAVMYFTLIMVLLLDPFAIVLVIATQIAYERRNSDLKIIPEDQDIIDESPPKMTFDEYQNLNIGQEDDIVDDEELDAEVVAENLIEDEKFVDFFNDEEMKGYITDSEEDVITKIDEVVNTENLSGNEKVEQVLKVLDSTLSPERMKEVKKRWLD